MSKCKRFSFVEDLQEVTPDGLYMRTVVGEHISIGVVKFVALKGAGIPAKSHAHGEEVSLQVRGGCEVYLGDHRRDDNAAHSLDEGRIMIMPAQEEHYGVNRFDSDGVCMRINVVTPPRKEFGSSGQETVYYPVQEPSR